MQETRKSSVSNLNRLRLFVGANVCLEELPMNSEYGHADK